MEAIDSVTINFSKSGLLALNTILGFIMFGVALDLRKDDFVLLIKNWKSAVVGFTSQYLLLPVLTFALVYLLEPSPGIALGMFLIAACPVGNVTNLITKVSRGNVALSIGLSSTAHLMASVLTPLNFALYGNLYAPTRMLMRTIQVDEFEMFLTVLLLIGVPLILGVFVQKQFPNFANRTKVFFNKLSMIFLLLFIIAAFASNAAVLVANLHLVYGFVILHNFVALGAGWSIAKLFRLPEADVRAITIESGIHNSGLGLFLIFQFFDGMGSMALVAACWGVWHLISGWLLAWYWSKN
jgi:bile acid:Na+ symporter, BASS family